MKSMEKIINIDIFTLRGMRYDELDVFKISSRMFGFPIGYRGRIFNTLGWYIFREDKKSNHLHYDHK